MYNFKFKMNTVLSHFYKTMNLSAVQPLVYLHKERYGMIFTNVTSGCLLVIDFEVTSPLLCASALLGLFYFYFKKCLLKTSHLRVKS